MDMVLACAVLVVPSDTVYEEALVSFLFRTHRSGSLCKSFSRDFHL